MKLRYQRLAALCSLALSSLSALAVSVTPMYISSTSAGPNSALDLYANITVASTDVGSIGNLYVVAALPGPVTHYFALNANGSWTPVSSTLPAAKSNVALGENVVQILSGKLDVSSIQGTVIYAGYGQNQADLLNNQKYSAIYTIGASAGGHSTIQPLNNQPPVDAGGGAFAFLMTDGTVIMQSVNNASNFYKLTPDQTGSYVNGTWSKIASTPTGYAPIAYASAVLADGRLMIVGGEYIESIGVDGPITPFTLTNMGAIYDPAADSWTMIPAPAGFNRIGDSPASIMPDGGFLLGDKLTTQMASFNPVSMSWTNLSTSGKNDFFAEEALTLLPNGNLLSIDVLNAGKAEHYVPSLLKWVSEPNTPATMAAPDVNSDGTLSYPNGISFSAIAATTVGGVNYAAVPAGIYAPPGEIGPAILRPDGSVFCAGANQYTPDNPNAMTIAHTAVYHAGATATSPGSWTAGPDFPGFDSAGDSSGALLTNGNVLVASNLANLYEFDGAQLIQMGTNQSQGGTFFLPLPNGQVLVIGSGIVYVYNSPGSPNASWAPTITGLPTLLSRGSSYVLTGTQLNGLSQAVSFGDEYQNATNYPLVRITNTASGHVVYAHTHGHTSMGVATGSASVSTTFDIPASVETGPSIVEVVANGIPSTPQNVTIQ